MPIVTETQEKKVRERSELRSYGPVKQMVRKISKMNVSIPQMGIDTAYDVDRELAEWIKAGFKLFFVDKVSEDAQSVDFLYILVAEE